MAHRFYMSDAVCGSIPKKNFKQTFMLCLQGSPYARGVMLEADGEVAGFALLSFTHSTEAGGLVVLLEELYVTECFRGKGLTTQFFNFIKAEYGKKAARFKLEVTQSNKHAIEVYKHYGFEVVEYLAMVRENTI